MGIIDWFSMLNTGNKIAFITLAVTVVVVVLPPLRNRVTKKQKIEGDNNTQIGADNSTVVVNQANKEDGKKT